MSTYAYVYLEKLNKKTKKWESYCVYDKDEKTGEFKPLPLWIGQGYLRDIIADRACCDYSSPFVVDDPDNFDNVSDYVTEQYHLHDDTEGWFNFYSNDDDEDEENKKPRNLTYNHFCMTCAQIEAYIHRHPQIDSYDEEYDETTDSYICPKIDNPMKEILNKIHLLMDLKDDWDFWNEYLNTMRIVGWSS